VLWLPPEFRTPESEMAVHGHTSALRNPSGACIFLCVNFAVLEPDFAAVGGVADINTHCHWKRPLRAPSWRRAILGLLISVACGLVVGLYPRLRHSYSTITVVAWALLLLVSFGYLLNCAALPRLQFDPKQYVRALHDVFSAKAHNNKA
jgi:hypothetical protein